MSQLIHGAGDLRHYLIEQLSNQVQNIGGSNELVFSYSLIFGDKQPIKVVYVLK